MTTLMSSLALATLVAVAVPSAHAAPAKPAEQRVTITVTAKGFQPNPVHVKAGRPVRLVITRKTDRTCATEIVVKEFGIKKPLPLNRTVEVRFTPRKAGTIRYACAMDMIAGQLVVD